VRFSARFNGKHVNFVKYLDSDLDEQDEDDDNKQVVDDSDYSDDGVDHSEHKIRLVARLQ